MRKIYDFLSHFTQFFVAIYAAWRKFKPKIASVDFFFTNIRNVYSALSIIVILAMFSLFVLAALLDLSKDQIMLCEDRAANVTC